MKIDTIIQELRTEKGYTQERLAQMLGVSTAAVSKWECANAYPDITLLPKIAEIFNVSIDYLLGYDISNQKSISEIINEANRLRKELKGDEAEELIRQISSRYPNNRQLQFELGRHKFINARYKEKTKRDILFAQASECFETVLMNDSDNNRRAWSIHFLTSINLYYKNYEKAAEYNAKLYSAKGLYPRVTSAIIKMTSNMGREAFDSVKTCMYESIYELSLLIPWMSAYLFDIKEYESVIKENLRIARVFEEFSDCGWIYNNLSICYETVALAYASMGDNGKSLDYIEKACGCAEKYDSIHYDLTYDVFAITDEASVVSEEAIKSRHLLYQALISNEREAYGTIRETDRYKAVISRLTKDEQP